MGNKNLVIGVFLLVVGGISFWFAQQSGRDDSAKAPAHTPDYYFEDMVAVLMDAQGNPSQRLEAVKMTHYPDDDSTELKKPRMTIYDLDRPPWKVRSDTGWLSGDGEVLLLNGKVNIDRVAAPGVRSLRMVTSDLRVQPKQNYAETDNPVHAVSHGDIIDSVGMQAWFNQPIRIKLLAKVRGHYDVKH